MNQEIMKEMQEIEQMVTEARKHEQYTEKYFILREGMIKLAGGFAQAALLSSLLGWTRHWLKNDNEIYMQIKAAAEVGNIEKIRQLKERIRQGWFWKSYNDMSKELLGEVSIKTCQRYVEKFEKMGLISSRDPEEKSTYRARWYKANIEKIKEELEKMGYQLDYYKDQKAPEAPICQNDKSQNKEVSASETAKPAPLSICQNDKSSGQNDKHLLYTSFITQSFNLDVVVVELFRKHMRVEITKKEAQEVINKALLHQKDIEKAIQEAVAWSEATGKELTSPVGSVLHAIEHGWNLSTYQPKTQAKAKQGNQRKGKKAAAKEKLPEMLRIQMEQEQQQPEENLDSVDRQKQIREKIRLVNEKFQKQPL